MFTEFETTPRASYSHRTTYFTRDIRFISRNISFRAELSKASRALVRTIVATMDRRPVRKVV
jgi:hypothetical protein